MPLETLEQCLLQYIGIWYLGHFDSNTVYFDQWKKQALTSIQIKDQNQKSKVKVHLVINGQFIGILY